MFSSASSGNLIAAFRELLVDDAASALTEYAIVASVFGVLMIGTMVAMQDAAGSNITTTQSGLSHESSAP
jgi:Flp pilus assembly pilin Flp